MAASPRWKVYNKFREYMAATKEIEAAACLVSFYGEGSYISLGHGRPLWTEVTDGYAHESFDVVGETVMARLSLPQEVSP